MTDISKSWWKGSFPSWMVTGLIGILTWFSIGFVKDREVKLEGLMKQQAVMMEEMINLKIRVPILEGNAASQANDQRRLSENMMALTRSIDRLTLLVDELRRKQPQS